MVKLPRSLRQGDNFRQASMQRLKINFKVNIKVSMNISMRQNRCHSDFIGKGMSAGSLRHQRGDKPRRGCRQVPSWALICMYRGMLMFLQDSFAPCSLFQSPRNHFLFRGRVEATCNSALLFEHFGPCYFAWVKDPFLSLHAQGMRTLWSCPSET